MENSNLQVTPLAIDQLREYARDVAEVYKSEKQKSEELKYAYQQLIKYGHDLSKTTSELKIANQELQQAYLDTIHRLVIAAEYKDEDTGDHIARISRYSALMAEKLGMSPKQVKNILYACLLYTSPSPRD